MYEDRWPQFDDLFERAVSLSTTERAVFLANECGHDHELVKRLEALLSVTSEEQDIIQSTLDQAIALRYSDMKETTLKQYGRYQVLEQIGEGGMGEVFKAIDPWLNRTVAIKVIKGSHHSEPEIRQRFQQEWELLAGFKGHPNIVQIFDISGTSIDSPLYMIMEFIEGKSLEYLMDVGGFGLFEALRYAIGIATALEVVHNKCIIHRDIKPSNVIITSSGDAKLLDFGIAKFLNPERNRVQTTSFALGTPGWVEPERRSGTSGDERSDIYVFGILLEKMLDIAILHTDADESAQNDAMAIAERCLRKVPTQRYSHIGNVKTDLEELMQAKGMSASVRPSATPPQRSNLAGCWTGWLKRPTRKRYLPNRFHFELYVVEHGNGCVSGVVLYAGWRDRRVVSRGADLNSFGPGGEQSPGGGPIHWKAIFKTHVHQVESSDAQAESSDAKRPTLTDDYLWEATVHPQQGGFVMDLIIVKRGEESKAFLKGTLKLGYSHN